MMIKLTLAAAALLACTSAVAAGGAATFPMKRVVRLHEQNAVAVTSHYLRKRSTVAVTPLTSRAGDVMYSVSLGVGSPPQFFNLVIDTGSPITWMVSKNCTGTGCDEVSNHFDCATSSTCKASPESGTLSAEYVSGESVLGDYVTDMFTLGPLHFPSLAGVVSKYNAHLPTHIDGVMGLWYPTRTGVKNVPDNSPFLKVIGETSLLAQKKFGLWIEGDHIGREDVAGGELTFGGVDPTRYTGEFTYINCISHPPWTIPVNGVSINGVKIEIPESHALIDSGTTALLLPRNLTELIHKQIPGSFYAGDGQYAIPCTGNSPLTLTFGDFSVSIPHKTLAIQNIRVTKGNDPKTPYCISSAMYAAGETSEVKQWLLGDVFLKNVYSVFDFGTNAATGGRIGFAQLATKKSEESTTLLSTTGTAPETNKNTLRSSGSGHSLTEGLPAPKNGIVSGATAAATSSRILQTVVLVGGIAIAML